MGEQENTLEYGTIEFTLAHTPNIEPYWPRAELAAKSIKAGDSNNVEDPYVFMHDILVARALDQKSPPHIKTPTGQIIVYIPEAVGIQANKLLAGGKNLGLAGVEQGQLLQTLTDYADTKARFREAHADLYALTLTKLSKADQNQIEHLRTLAFPPKLYPLNEPVSLVFMPWYADSPRLWKDLGMAKYMDAGYQKGEPLISSFGKAHEIGVIFSSHRPILNGEDHDLTTHHFRSLVAGRIPSIHDGYISTAQHEGSHYLIDYLLMKILGLSDTNPIYEMIPGVLGNDGRELIPTTITVYNILNLPLAEPAHKTQEYRKELNYVAAPKLLKAIHNLLLKSEGQSETETWAKIFAQMLTDALRYSKDPNYQRQTENNRTALVMHRFLMSLDLDLGDVISEYHDLNKPRGKPKKLSVAPTPVSQEIVVPKTTFESKVYDFAKSNGIPDDPASLQLYLDYFVKANLWWHYTGVERENISTLSSQLELLMQKTKIGKELLRAERKVPLPPLTTEVGEGTNKHHAVNEIFSLPVQNSDLQKRIAELKSHAIKLANEANGAYEPPAPGYMQRTS